MTYQFDNTIGKYTHKGTEYTVSYDQGVSYDMVLGETPWAFMTTRGSNFALGEEIDSYYPQARLELACTLEGLLNDRSTHVPRYWQDRDAYYTEDQELVERFIQYASKYVQIQEIEKYEHGSVHYSLHYGGTSWDRGMVGYAVCHKHDLWEYYGKRKDYGNMLRIYLGNYSNWANGNVYQFEIDGEYYGGILDLEFLHEYAREEIENM